MFDMPEARLVVGPIAFAGDAALVGSRSRGWLRII